MGLVVAKKRQFLATATELIDRVKKQFTHEPTRLELLNLLEAIIIAKLPKLSRRELEIMFGVEDLRNTRFAQELIAEGKIEGKTEGKVEGKVEGKLEAKLETIPELLKEGLSQEKIAAILKLDLQKVREYINNMN